MLVEKIDPLPAGNPFNFDLFHMGVRLGDNVMAMMRNHQDDHCPYLIICDVQTGERLRIRFDQELPQDVLPVK